MNDAEARSILVRHLERYRAMPYANLQAQVGEIEAGELTAENGAVYQFEVSILWDDPERPNDVVRIFGSIDDGGIRAFAPLCESFLVAPDGSFP